MKANLWILLLAIWLSFSVVPNNAIIPRRCAKTIIGPFSICCPVPNGFQDRCGGPGRGSCLQVRPPSERIARVYWNDDRLLWPMRFFRYACSCEGHFFGPACDECWYGWTGSNCDVPVQRVRRNALSLNRAQRKLFLDVITLSANYPSDYLIFEERDNWRSDPMRAPQYLEVSVLQQLVFAHRFASRGTLFNNKRKCSNVDPLNFNHNGCGFLTWHRYFMMFWERELQKIALAVFGVRDFTVPYWDWIDAERCDVCSNDLMGRSGAQGRDGFRLSIHSPLYNLTDYCSSPDEREECTGCHASNRFSKLTRRWSNNNFPTSRDLIFVLRHRRYHDHASNDGRCTSLQRSLEGFCGQGNDPDLFMHNRLHNMVQGTFANSPTSVNDPLFILHHIFVDKILQAWFRWYRPNSREMWNQNSCAPGHCANCNMVSFIPVVTHRQMFTDCRNLGYTYDNMNFGRRGLGL